jgi:Retrotransposon gag protein
MICTTGREVRRSVSYITTAIALTQPNTNEDARTRQCKCITNPASEILCLSDHEHDLPPIPPLKSHAPLVQVQPASPSEFSGDCMTGCMFLNLCNLCIGLTSDQFPNDQAKVLWAFSFMKGGRAVHFVGRKMHMYHIVGSLNYSTWHEFAQQFTEEFCPKNEIQTAWTDLKTATYFQGSWTIDEYVNDFKETVDKACYFEGLHIVLKFCQGLNSKIQDYIACLTKGQPSDKTPSQLYAAVILCDENRIANAMFTSSPRTTDRE